MILRRRPAIYKAFDNFDYQQVARYSLQKLTQLLNDSSIIRNRAKITAIIHNAKILVKIHHMGITLEQLTWSLVNRTPLDHLLLSSTDSLNYCQFIQQFLVEFRYYNFKRIGPKTLYSYLQAVGVVNDHVIKCFRHSEISKIIR